MKLKTSLILSIFYISFAGCNNSSNSEHSRPTAISGTSTTLPQAYYGYKYSKGAKVTIRENKLGRCLAKELKSFDEESSGIIWSSHKARFPDLLSFLAGSDDVDYIVNSELKFSLEEWVLSQNDNSITPVKILRESLQLNEGDVFLSFLMIHNLLRQKARFFSEYITAHGYSGTYEEMNLFYNKFIDLRGDLQERGNSYSGDHPGTWYRFWGMMLYYIRTSPISEASVTYKHTGFRLAYLENSFVANIAEWVKPLIGWKEADGRKAEINRKSVKTAIIMLQAYLGNPRFPLPDEPCNNSIFYVN